MVPNPGDAVPSRGHLAIPGDVLVVITGGGRDAAVTSGQRPGLLLGAPHTAQPPQRKAIWPQMSTEPRLRNSLLWGETTQS